MSERLPHPFLSVIVPAHQAAHMLRQGLEAIVKSDLPREAFELIVIDDASMDETSVVAAEFADIVIRLAGKPNGPAFARNRGFEVSRGEVLVFVDADVVVHPDALRRLAAHFVQDPDLASVFGSYDDDPASPGIVSRYRNLMHHYVHHANAGPAQTFWAGLGAIRRTAFAGVGMFDEWSYGRPQIEDIELGRRLRRHGYSIWLDPAIQGKHLKRWTLRGTLEADFKHRGVPWMWLMLQEGDPGNQHTLNVRTAEKWCTALVCLGVPAMLLAIPLHSAVLFEMAALAVGAAFIYNMGFYRFLAKTGGVAFMLAAMPLHLLYYMGNGLSGVSGWVVHTLFGEPIPSAEMTALAQTGVKTWPPPPRRPPDSMWERPRIANVGPPPGVPDRRKRLT